MFIARISSGKAISWREEVPAVGGSRNQKLLWWTRTGFIGPGNRKVSQKESEGKVHYEYGKVYIQNMPVEEIKLYDEET